MAEGMFLYWGSGSIPCWKVMIVLEEKGLQGYGKKQISFDKNETKGADILKLNPRGEVPTFKDGDVIINESSAICDYLEFKYGGQGNRLLPLDTEQRARVLQRVNEAQNVFKTLIEGVLYYQFNTKTQDIDQEHLNTKMKEAKEELKLWEGYLEKEGPGSYIAGASFSLADVFLFPCLAFAVRLQLQLDPWPLLKDYYLRLRERPSITASWPPHWRGSQGRDYFQGF